MEPTWGLGIDFGTSGARAIALAPTHEICAQAQVSLTEQTSEAWQAALLELLYQLPLEVRSRLQRIAINGTSATVLLCDRAGVPVAAPLLYNDDRGAAVLEAVRAIAPPQHPVISATSSLAKLLWWEAQGWGKSWGSASTPYYLLHQADWLAFQLHGKLGVSDYHNALKLGYDVGTLGYPAWLRQRESAIWLPQVVAPGRAIAPLIPALATALAIPHTCQICAGTTDSIAAFLASGASETGEAVTSLGSTLVLKLLSQTRVDDARYGIYSHRLGDRWLVGGASNTGGAVLRQFFSDAELTTYSQQIDPSQPSPLSYYPLPRPGERFPLCDPDLAPQLEPRPADPVAFLAGLLEGMARIEALGYQRLQALGASPLRRVLTAGGGAQNQAWQAVRSRHLHLQVEVSPQTAAAYGSALLALGQWSGSGAREWSEEL